jgi:Holliday junction resolvasome RuvABC endonuclease subunit
MRILGVDPGLRITGYGVVEGSGARFHLIEGGVLRPDAGWRNCTMR